MGGQAAAGAGPASGRRRRGPRVVVLVATRKGAWLFHGGQVRKRWRADGPHFLGHIVHHLMLDPRDNRTLLAAAKTGHLGPTIFRSTDRGGSWQEAAQPPAFARPEVDGEKGRVVDHSFWLTPGAPSEPGVWYAGTSPQGLFRSEDGGASWAPMAGVNEDARYRKWMGSEQDGTPDGPKLHSIIVDPRDPAHLYFAMSGGGVHESTDGGASWQPLVDGMAVVGGFDPNDISFHDPHCVRICPSRPDRLYQQNHCGIYRLDRPSKTWVHVGGGIEREIGDIGFPMVVHPRDAEAAWVFPMDATDVWPRTSPGGRPAVYATRDGGGSWQRCGPARGPGLVDRQAPGDERRRDGSGRAVFRHHQWRAVDEPRRGSALELHRAPPARDLCRRGGRASHGFLMKVFIPNALGSYTRGSEAEAQGATLAEVLADLDRQYPGIRFRMVDEQDRIRPHIRVFVNGGQFRELSRPLVDSDEIYIVQALSGG